MLSNIWWDSLDGSTPHCKAFAYIGQHQTEECGYTSMPQARFEPIVQGVKSHALDMQPLWLALYECKNKLIFKVINFVTFLFVLMLLVLLSFMAETKLIFPTLHLKCVSSYCIRTYQSHMCQGHEFLLDVNFFIVLFYEVLWQDHIGCCMFLDILEAGCASIIRLIFTT